VPPFFHGLYLQLGNIPRKTFFPDDLPFNLYLPGNKKPFYVAAYKTVGCIVAAVFTHFYAFFHISNMMITGIL
jgi:hypothetical protein